MWYLIVSKTFLVLVLALLGIYAWTNISFALDLWRRGSGKERAISALGIVLLAGVFLTTLSWNLIDYAKNWGSTPKSYFAQGGEFEKKEHAAGRATVYDKESTPAPTPNYPTFDLVQTLAGNAATNPESNEGATHFETAVAFSPNGNLIASGDWGGTLRIWDAASGQLMHTITGLFNIKFLSFSPDGRWIVAPMVDRKIGVWDVATATLARTVAGGGDCVAFDSTGKWLATTNGGNIVNIWDPATGKLLKTFDAQAGVFSMAFAPGNPFPPYNGTPQRPTVLATGGGDGAVRLWDGENGKLLQTLTGHRGWVSSLAFTSYDLAALGYEDGELRVWSIPSGELEHIISAPATSIVFFGTDNYMLTAGTGDGTVRFWDAHTGAELRPLQAHTQQVNSVAISPNGRWLATASKDKTTKVWKLK
jgi:WD40 repeat protein